MSAPALKCAPSPATSATSTSSRASIAVRIAGRACHIARVIALRRSGRLRTMRANGGSKRREISVMRSSRRAGRDAFRPSLALLRIETDGLSAARAALRGRARERRRAERQNGLDWRLCQSYLSRMKKASITETKNNLSALIDGLRGGSPVLIVDRGRPVARLEPVAGREDGGQDGRLSRLVRDGVLRPRRTGPPAALFSASPPRANASAVELLIKERWEGR